MDNRWVSRELWAQEGLGGGVSWLEEVTDGLLHEVGVAQPQGYSDGVQPERAAPVERDAHYARQISWRCKALRASPR